MPPTSSSENDQRPDIVSSNLPQIKRTRSPYIVEGSLPRPPTGETSVSVKEVPLGTVPLTIVLRHGEIGSFFERNYSEFHLIYYSRNSKVERTRESRPLPAVVPPESRTPLPLPRDSSTLQCLEFRRSVCKVWTGVVIETQ